MQVELLLQLSGLTRQEILVIKACAPDVKSFESVASTLVEQYNTQAFTRVKAGI